MINPGPDEPYERFLKRDWKPNWHCHPSPKNAILEMVLIEPRDHPYLEGALKNMSCLLPYAALTIIHSATNAAKIHRIVGTAAPSQVRMLQILPDNITRDEYSSLLTSVEFWDRFDSLKVLMFQCDSGMRFNNVLRFMEFDWIGAPWPWPILGEIRIEQGNGGFSLRSVEWMKYIVKTFPFHHKYYESEDIYFARHMIDCDSANVATRDEAASFSVEYIANRNPMGFHQAWRFKYSDEFKKHLLEEGLDISKPPLDIQIRSAWIETEDMREMFVEGLVDWMRLGVGPSGFRLGKHTKIPMDADPYPGLQKILKLTFTIGKGPMQLMSIKLNRGRTQDQVEIDAKFVASLDINKSQ